MNYRFFVALVLTAIVIIATPLLFPSTRRVSNLPALADSSKKTVVVPRADTSARPATAVSSKTVVVPRADTSARPATAVSSATNSSVVQPNQPVIAAETTTVVTAQATYAFTSVGGAPISILLDSYPSLRPNGRGQKAELVEARAPLAGYRLVLGRDTIALDTLALRAEKKSEGKNTVLNFTGQVAGRSLQLAYAFTPQAADDFLIRVSATVSNPPVGSGLLIQLPKTLHSNEADTLDDLNHLAVSYRPSHGDVKSLGFSKLDSTEVRAEPGPINWVATRDKYFLAVFRATKTPFSALRLQGAPREGKVASKVDGSLALPLSPDGVATFEIYAGPQNFERLQQLGGDLDQVNPYAGWLHGVVQPFATIVMKALLWMKRTTHLNYGWVLVLFGVIIRFVLWPLNQGAMRTSMKMQRLQPELQAIQKKHSDDPKRQQEAIMKVYKEHGMSPLSPLMGCLPMLLPMPVLFALYYVFQNTIEFRGVPFLWLPDLSLRDPYYITPLLMGVSMFVMSWIGMRNSPPNAQAKMMSYMMPVMLTVLFLNFASGLNLYYAVQNIAALPQQWLLARERGKPSSSILPGTLEKQRN
jgi:YidC/Oxa1 family membrane protein insertase